MQGKMELHNSCVQLHLHMYPHPQKKMLTNSPQVHPQTESLLEKKYCFSLKPDVLPLQAAICRSSQPLSGFSARCLEDEQMLEAILRSNPRSDFMYVVDTRPKVRGPHLQGSA